MEEHLYWGTSAGEIPVWGHSDGGEQLLRGTLLRGRLYRTLCWGKEHMYWGTLAWGTPVWGPLLGGHLYGETLLAGGTLVSGHFGRGDTCKGETSM